MFVLEDLWQGHITPSLRAVQPGSPYEKISEASVEKLSEFRKELSAEGKKALDDYCDLEMQLAEISAQDAFIKGVRFGARFILDILGPYSSQLPQIQDGCNAG